MRGAKRNRRGTTALAARRTAKRARSCGRGRPWLGSDHGWSSAAAVPKRHATRVRGVVVMTVGSALKAARITSSAGRCGRRLLRDRCDAWVLIPIESA